MNIPRGIRNNNPGNINFANQEYAVLEPKSNTVPHPRFAKFDTMDHGIAALIKQLKLYFSRDINTVRSIISKWAPPTENNTRSYINYVANSIKTTPDAVLTPTPEVLASLAFAISRLENGTHLAPTYSHILTISRSMSDES